MKKLLYTALLMPGLAFSCPQPVKYLKKGEQAPCTGFLFSPKKELELRLMKEENKYLAGSIDIIKTKSKLYKAMNEDLKAIADKEAKRSELWRQRAIDSTQKLVSQQEDRGKRDFLFIGLGVLLTVGAGWAIGQAN